MIFINVCVCDCSKSDTDSGRYSCVFKLKQLCVVYFVFGPRSSININILILMYLIILFSVVTHVKCHRNRLAKKRKKIVHIVPEDSCPFQFTVFRNLIVIFAQCSHSRSFSTADSPKLLNIINFGIERHFSSVPSFVCSFD